MPPSSQVAARRHVKRGEWSVYWDVRPHHLVVLVVEDVAVHHVGRAHGGVERVLVLPGGDAVHRGGLRGPADHEPVHVTGVRLDRVLPADLVRVRGDNGTGQARGEGGVAAQRAVRVLVEVV